MKAWTKLPLGFLILAVVLSRGGDATATVSKEALSKRRILPNDRWTTTTNFASTIHHRRLEDGYDGETDEAEDPASEGVELGGEQEGEGVSEEEEADEVGEDASENEDVEAGEEEEEETSPNEAEEETSPNEAEEDASPDEEFEADQEEEEASANEDVGDETADNEDEAEDTEDTTDEANGQGVYVDTENADENEEEESSEEHTQDEESQDVEETADAMDGGGVLADGDSEEEEPGVDPGQSEWIENSEEEVYGEVNSEEGGDGEESDVGVEEEDESTAEDGEEEDAEDEEDEDATSVNGDTEGEEDVTGWGEDEDSYEEEEDDGDVSEVDGRMGGDGEEEEEEENPASEVDGDRDEDGEEADGEEAGEEEDGEEYEGEDEETAGSDHDQTNETNDEEEEEEEGEVEELGAEMEQFYRAGAEKAKKSGGHFVDPQVVAKFKERLEQQRMRKRFRPFRSFDSTNAQVARDGETDSMKAYRPPTPEYLARRTKILDAIEKRKGKEVREKVEARWRMIEQSGGVNGRVPYRKEVSKPRLSERIPIVKRVVKMSQEEELMLDISLAFIAALRDGVFKEQGPLPSAKQQALKIWLELLTVSLPEEWGIHELIDDLSAKLVFISRSHSNLENVLSKYQIKRYNWSGSCTSSNYVQSFNCGFWKLLHTMTVGVAQHQGGQYLIKTGMRKKESLIFSPSSAAKALRDYMQYFFPYDTYSKEFVSTYDDCAKNRRCDRLSDDIATASYADWKELAKWLWEVHNDISVRLAKQNSAQKRSAILRRIQTQDSATAYIAALWPSMESCLTCFNDDGGWNENAIFLHLEKVYWPAASPDPRTAKLLRFDEEFDPEGSRLSVVLFVGVLILAYNLIATLRKVGLQQTLVMARTLAPKGQTGAHKRAE